MPLEHPGHCSRLCLHLLHEGPEGKKPQSMFHAPGKSLAGYTSQGEVLRALIRGQGNPLFGTSPFPALSSALGGCGRVDFPSALPPSLPHQAIRWRVGKRQEPTPSLLCLRITLAGGQADSVQGFVATSLIGVGMG